MTGTIPRFKYRSASFSAELRGTSSSAATFDSTGFAPSSVNPLDSVAALRQRLSSIDAAATRQIEPRGGAAAGAPPRVYLADGQVAPTDASSATIPRLTSLHSTLNAATTLTGSASVYRRHDDILGSHDPTRGLSPLPSAPSSAPDRTPRQHVSVLGTLQRDDADGLYAAQPPLQPLNLPPHERANRVMQGVSAQSFSQQQYGRTGAAPYRGRSSRDVESVTVDEDNDDVSSVASTASLPPLLGEDVPVVPPEVLKYCAEPLAWQGHPCAPIVLSLLNARCVFLPAQQDLVSYHMAPGFLYALQHLQLGSYFVKYGIRRSAPKERFFSIRCLENSLGHVVPYLTWTLHQHAHQLVDKVPLTQFVGVTTGVGEEAFQRYMLDGNIIKGCRQGPHHAKLPTTGAMTLWFYDLRKQAARSLSLLTCSTSVFDLWTSTLRGIAAVNSVQIREVGMSTTPAPTADQLLREAQYQVRNAVHDDDDDDPFDSSF